MPSIPLNIRRQAFEGLLHHYPVKTLARELNISRNSVAEWKHFIANDFYDWLDRKSVGYRNELNELAAQYWLEHYPVRYSDVAYQFGIRESSLYGYLKRRIDTMPAVLRPKRIRFWDEQEPSTIGAYRMSIEKLSDIPADRPLSPTERKALFAEIQDAKARLICAESILEVAEESCKDELKKKEIRRQLEQVRKVLASYKSADA